MFWGAALEITVNYLLSTREPANKTGVKQRENLQASSSEGFHVCTTTTTDIGMFVHFSVLLTKKVEYTNAGKDTVIPHII